MLHIYHQFYPSVLADPISKCEVWLFDLPCHGGGLGTLLDPICDLFIFFPEFC